MGQEYFINSQTLEDKVRNLLPSQGGLGAGQDLSASTQIVPIIDLTESAEGSNVRADLQTALSFDSVSTFVVGNTTTTLISNTGYFRVFGNFTSNGDNVCKFILNDGATTKDIISFICVTGTFESFNFDFIVFLKAGDSLQAQSTTANGQVGGSTRQIADIDGNLVNP